MRMDIDTSGLVGIFQEYKEATGHDGAYILNRAMRNIAFHAIEDTQGATKERITHDLVDGTDRSGGHAILFRLVNAERKRHGLAPLGRGVHSDLATMKKQSRRKGAMPSVDSMSIEAQKFLAKRIASRNFLRSGWFKVITDLGYPVNNRHAMAHAKSSTADKSFAKKATPANLIGIMENDAYGAGIAQDSIEGLRKAVEEVAKDMDDFAKKKLAETAKRLSAK